MSWKATKEGFIYAGVKHVKRLNGGVDTVEAVLPKGQIVIIFSMRFRLTAESITQCCSTESRRAEITKNGDYEDIEYYVFPAVDYERLMSWKGAERGMVCTGVRKLTPLRRNIDTVNWVLPKGRVVLVYDMCFKLTTEGIDDDSVPKYRLPETTINGDYEDIEYRLFLAVDYDRRMSWKATEHSSIETGVEGQETKLDGSVDMVDVILPKGHIATVYCLCFKLTSES
jgi:hypothetical protein